MSGGAAAFELRRARRRDAVRDRRHPDGFDDPDARGLLYDTPRGQLAVLWSRADGYTLNTQGTHDGGCFPAPEPWVDVWPTKSTLTLRATGKVTEVDALGRSRAGPVRGRQATLTLDGAARLYYGLDLAGA